MENYLFVLGRNSELSLAELVSYFKRKNIENKLIKYNKEVAIFSLPKLDYSEVILELGGCVKIGKILFIAKDEDELEFELDKVEIYNKKFNKIKYGVSFYGRKDLNLLDFLKSYLKKRLKKEKLKASFKAYKKKGSFELMPSEIIRKDILEKGFELVLFKDEEIVLAKTIAVFDPFKYKERDLKRPKKEILKESSIRLAKILINLSEITDKEILLDPFCGSGVILQEALLVGLGVKGIDISKESVENCKVNLEWLKKEYGIKNSFEIFLGDSTKDLVKADRVVSEPYLGPFLKEVPCILEVKKIVKDLEEMYDLFLKQLRKIKVKKSVIVVPEFKTKEGRKISVNFKETLEKNEFRISKLEEIKFPIKYEEGFLDRYIYVFEPK